MAIDKKVVVFVGGVGGAKLALGLQHVLLPQNLTVVVNIADDFFHYGLRICPDIDTVLYTLSGRVDTSNGWGVANDSTIMLETLRGLGADAWFRLGDKDLATHLLRLNWLTQGKTLTQIVQHLAQAMSIGVTVLPMSNQFVETKVQTKEHGELDFQEYFVRYRWQPTVTGLRYENAEIATPTPEVTHAIAEADILLFAPSNPWLSIAPILAVNGMRQLILAKDTPKVAISPIVDGKAIKGPAAKLAHELGYEASPTHVAQFYGKIINGFVYDTQDSGAMFDQHRHIALDTMMHTDADKARLATQTLEWIASWS
jgi:LPPG:FO 2-phospho-L-lactate transferase